ncbi:MAG: trypsin-like peptidase domain-containing protein [Solirubrobacteraceae bacterium]
MNSKAFFGGALAAAAIAAGGGVLALQLQSDASAGTTAATPPPASQPISTRDAGARRVYDRAKESVAYISAATQQGQSTGSGFVVSSDGLIVTNAHVVEGAGQVTVKVGTASGEQPATVVGTDASHDLALLKVDASGLPALELADASKLSVGDPTYAIGNPYGLDHTLTTGVVSALHREIQSPDGSTISDVIQTDAAINPGNSGGPLLDGSGRVVGVNSQIVSGGGSGGGGGNVGIGFAIPSNTVAESIGQLKSGQGAQPSAPATPQDGSQDGSGGGVSPDPYGLEPDPYGGQSQAPSDPNGPGQQADPYGGAQADPYGGAQADPYGGAQADPYGGAQADPYGGLLPTG